MTLFVNVSIKGVIKTFIEALFLVLIVVFLFLQNRRIILILILVVPVDHWNFYLYLHTRILDQYTDFVCLGFGYRLFSCI
ncbi:MAG: efflux RND transporter permease subunit [Flavobacteriales bacterium]